MILQKSNLNLSFLLLFGLGFLFLQCGDNKGTPRSPRIRNLTKVLSPKNEFRTNVGVPVNFELVTIQDSVKIDSFRISLGTKLIYNSNSSVNGEFVFSQTGRHNLSYSVYLNNGTKEQQSQFITVLSSIIPAKYTYRKVNTYTHDPDAYTQGLTFDEGIFFESTGHKGESSLRKVDITTGNVIQKIDLEEQYFGEGITLRGDEIFMLTWESRKGFVFNKTDFSIIREFSYPMQGWGITTMGDSLAMTDESEKIYFMEPDTFTEIGRIEVYDQNGPVDALNELEYINGKIYANVYQTDNIVIIDPKSGQVTGVINLEGIFNKQNYDRRLDVLNGIAYDSKSDRLFVTGKYFPKLFEIDLVPLDEPSI